MGRFLEQPEEKESTVGGGGRGGEGTEVGMGEKYGGAREEGEEKGRVVAMRE